MGLLDGSSRSAHFERIREAKNCNPGEKRYKLPLPSVSRLLHGHAGRSKKWETPTKVF